ncbi:multifunctional CCA protein [Desulfosporosinus acididurans]|uniref:Multifunctional CCA protein n=1 Tax=Desulfosporosinus acididurans TaxID=476652 RepID=A0A0J1FTM7_9FIRM|nr:HD domain-containing protein [Desulfosporosinus acididurans]KLU66637.1 multifunctional CCA protein [Desulfosporosinus acididurans]
MLGSSFQQEVLKRLSLICPVYCVGGAVRDAELGIPNKDVDAVAALPPEEIFNLLTHWGYTPHLLGAKLQTISLFQESDRLDLVSFPGELERDALRRDFTINAIYQDVNTGEIEDPFQGLSDLRNRYLRTCGNPSERFEEDPLRVLRMIRFAVKYGLSIENETWQSAVIFVPQLSEVSKERVTEELGKILVLENIAQSLSLLDRIGFFQLYIPELFRLKGLAQNRFYTKDVWDHTLKVVQYSPEQITLRLAALFHDLGRWQTVGREKGHYFPHDKESARLSREIFSRFRWSMVLPGGAHGEQEVEYLVRHHSLGSRTFRKELRGEADWRKVSFKARCFAWKIGWNGQFFDPLRVENLLKLWLADLQGGRQVYWDNFERYTRIQSEVRAASLWITERIKTLDWKVFTQFVQEKGLRGKSYGRFKEQVRRVLIRCPEYCLNDTTFLEAEYQTYLLRDAQRLGQL